MSRSLLVTLFWVFAALCAVGQLAVLRAVIAGYAPASSRRPHARWTEILWVAIPAVILLLVLAATWRTMQPVVSVAVPPGQLG